MANTLDAVHDLLPVVTPSEVTIDISAMCGQPAGTTVLTLREPTPAAYWSVLGDAQLVRARHGKWPDSLCQSVAMLGLCHISPQPARISPGEFYTHMCDRSHHVFLYVLQKFQQAFPGLSDWDNAVEQGKTA